LDFYHRRRIVPDEPSFIGRRLQAALEPAVYRSLEELPNQLFGFESIELTKAVSAFAYVDMYARVAVHFPVETGVL